MGLPDLLQPRVCELGKIKIGGKGAERPSRAGGSFRLPEKYDHFVVTTMQRDGRGDFVPDESLMTTLSRYADADGRLRQLPVAVLSNDLEDVLQAGHVWYQGKRVAGRSDGVTCTLFYDRKNSAWLKDPVVTPWCQRLADATDDKGVKLFKLHATLNVVIAAESARWGGYYKFRTTSVISANQLYGSLLHLRELTGGQLRGLPLMLVVRPVQVAPDGKPTTVYVVHVELRGADLQSIQERAMERARFEVENRQRMATMHLEYRRLLSAPGEGDTESEADAAEEFAPTPPQASASAQDGRVPDPLAARLAQDGARPEPLAATTDQLVKIGKLSADMDAAEFGAMCQDAGNLDVRKLNAPQAETLISRLNDMATRQAEEDAAERDAPITS